MILLTNSKANPCWLPFSENYDLQNCETFSEMVLQEVEINIL